MGEEEKWRPEACVQQSSATWLQSYGLESQSLSMDQLLPTLGFKQKTGSVPTSSDKVTSVYSEGLFVQYPDSRGNLYNVCANDTQLVRIEQQLNQFVYLLKSRLQWLNSSSRLLLGALVHSHAILIIDSSLSDPNQLTSFLDAVKLFLKEQVSAIVKFNIIRCTGSLTSFADNLLKVLPGVVQEGIDWLDEAHSSSANAPMTNNLIEAVTRAIACEGNDAVYLLTQGRSALRSYSSLHNMLQLSHVPVNISVYECTDSGALEDYKELCRVCNGRLHVYNPKSPVYDPIAPVSSRPSSAASSTNSSSSKTKMPPSLPRDDVLLVWEELERGRDTLAEIQLIQLEKQTVGRSDKHPLPRPCKEEYMSSIQWIDAHGLKANSLLFSDLVNKLAFQHCEGVLRTSSPAHESTNNKYNDVQMVEQSKLVGAQYCKDFVHLKWRNGNVIHVHLDERTYQNYHSKVLYYVKKYEERSDWLKKDSRELFGTILENKIVVVIDTSSSLEGRFNLIKRKLRQLLREQILHKTAFNLIQFSTDVIKWRDHLVPTTPQNISAAREWIDGMGVSGSTNTLEALQEALSISGAEAVYFLTDGRPDQSPDLILSQIQQLRRVPIHSISFNCADSKANQFLFRLASVTGGRYHYYSEDITDPKGPVTHQSDDLQLLSDEISHAHDQLTQAQQLREACSRLKHSGQRLVYPIPRRKKPKRLSTSDNFVSLSKWLKKNSLSRRNLLLMDALGPTAVPHNPKHVPILDKKIHGKVYEGLLSTAHVSGKGNVTLVNPSGVDLVSYESKLTQYINECECVMERAIVESLPLVKLQDIKEKVGLEDSERLQYKEHREELREGLRDGGCGSLLSELDKVEAEIKKAGVLMSQAAALREECSGKRKNKKWSSDMSLSSSVSDNSSGTAPTISDLNGGERTINTSIGSPVKTSLSNEYGRSIKRGHHVIGPDPTDGLYYPGMVSSVPSGGSCQVLFSTGVSSNLPIKLLLPIKGSTPCPTLRPGDYVFVRTRIKILKGDIYLPGVIMALPENPRVGGALFSASIFGGRIVTCSRSSLVKIGRVRYREACDCLINWLKKREKLDYRDTGPTTSTPNKEMIHVLPREPPSNLSSSDESIPVNAHSPVDSKPLSPLSPGPEDVPSDAPSYHGPVTIERGTSPIPLNESRGLIDKETCTSLQSLIVDNEEEGEREREKEGVAQEPEESVDKSGDLTIGMLDSTQDQNTLSKSAQDEEEQVLARWMDDGWYYRSIVVSKGEESWTVRDANGDEEVCPRDDIITDHDDASVLIKVGDPVISLHPSFPLSYAPGTVIGIMSDGLSFLVELYDEMQGLVPRHELYSCPQSKVEEVIEYIKIQEKAWLGKPVIARKPTDYLFHPGLVLKQHDSSQDFVIRWSDNTTHTIEVTDMFGELTRRRPLYTDDYVIALPEEDDGGGVCYPGKIVGVQGEKLIIQLHNNKLCLASFDHCFWISDSYYHNSVALIGRVKGETNE